MKCFKYISLYFLGIFFSNAWGQTIVIPDDNFLNYLKNNYPSTITAQNQLNTQEAATVSGSMQCYDVNISNIEGIQYFTSLEELDLSNNKLTTLPDISGMVALTSLDVSQNNLTALPDLSSLSALEYLNAENNSIQIAPDLSSISSLKRIDLDKNELTEFPNIKGLINLYHVDLDDNYLTFEDIIPYTSWPDFHHDFDVSPQKEFQVAYDTSFTEGETLILTTGIDSNIPYTTYDWFFNGNYFLSTNKDTLMIPNVSSFFEGTFTCHIEHPSVYDLKLDINNYHVSILPCVDISNLDIVTTPINCFESGKIVIDFNSLPTANYLFTLTGQVSGKTTTSTSGSFHGLTEQVYNLSVTTDGTCMLNYDSTIVLEKKECEEILITPNNDGYEDNYYFDTNGEIVIYDKNGVVVKKLYGPTFWDGSLDGSRSNLANGYYVAKLAASGKYINITVIH